MIKRLRDFESVMARLESALSDAYDEIVLTSAAEERMRGLVSRVQANERHREIRVSTVCHAGPACRSMIRIPANDNPRGVSAPEMRVC